MRKLGRIDSDRNYESAEIIEVNLVPDRDMFAVDIGHRSLVLLVAGVVLENNGRQMGW